MNKDDVALLFIDESGGSEMLTNTEPFFIFAGVSVIKKDFIQMRDLWLVWKETYLKEGADFHGAHFFEKNESVLLEGSSYEEALAGLEKIVIKSVNCCMQVSITYCNTDDLKKYLNFPEDNSRLLTKGKQGTKGNMSASALKASLYEEISVHPNANLKEALYNLFGWHCSNIARKYYRAEIYAETTDAKDADFLKTYYGINHSCDEMTYQKKIQAIHLISKNAGNIGIEFADCIAYCYQKHLQLQIGTLEKALEREWHKELRSSAYDKVILDRMKNAGDLIEKLNMCPEETTGADVGCVTIVDYTDAMLKKLKTSKKGVERWGLRYKAHIEGLKLKD